MKKLLYACAVVLLCLVFMLPLFLAILASNAHAASCIGNWPGSQRDATVQTQQREHKALHLIGSAVATAGVAWAADDVRWGIAAGAGLGLAREIQKATSPGMRCEWSSMTYDALGIALGAWGASRWIVTPRRQGVQVAWVGRF